MSIFTNSAKEKHATDMFPMIVRKRVEEYIDREVKGLVKKKTDEIVTEVLANLKVDAALYYKMEQHERELVVKAIYNGGEVTKGHGE